MIFRRKNDFGQFSTSGWFSSRINRIGRRLMEGMGQEDNDRSDPAGNSFLRWLTFPFRIVWAFLVFLVTTWSSTRPGNSFGRAMPAILAVGSFAGVLVLAYNIPFRVAGISFPDPAMRYEGRSVFLRELASSKTDPKEKKELLEGALVCARHLVAIRPTNNSYKYLLGLALAENGDILGARNIMQFIAPEDKQGLSMAHIWLAIDLLNTESGEARIKDERQDLAYKHLRMIEQSTANNESIEGYFARVRMAALMMDEKKYEEAEELLKAVVEGQLKWPVQLEAIVRLANVFKAQEKKAQLAAFVFAANGKLGDLSLRQPDIPEIWETMVTLNVVMDDFPSAVSNLQSGIVAARDPDVRMRLLQMQSILFIRQSQLVPDIESREDYKKKFLILARAIVVNPTVPDVYIALLPYLDVNRPNTEEAVWLRELFLDSETPGGVLHAVIGMRDLLNGRFAEGQDQWMTASSKLETAGIVINNFLQVLAEKKPEDMENFFNLASVAIEMFPDQYFFYFTRAKILQKLNRLDQARKDLELVVEKIPQAVEPRQLLMEIGEQQGDTAFVERLTQEIAAIEARKEAERRKELEPPK